MTIEEIIEALDAIDHGEYGDSEAGHSQADELLLLAVPPAVRDAYNRVVARASWWATA